MEPNPNRGRCAIDFCSVSRCADCFNLGGVVFLKTSETKNEIYKFKCISNHSFVLITEQTLN